LAGGGRNPADGFREMAQTDTHDPASAGLAF